MAIWKFLILVISTIMVAYSIFTIVNYFKVWLINKNMLSEKLIKLKSQKRYYTFMLICPLIFILYLSTINIEKQSILNQAFYLTLDIFILIAIVDYIMSIFITTTIFEEGIVSDRGKMIAWHEIKSLECKMMSFTLDKLIVIEYKGNRLIKLKIANKDYNYVKELIFNKSGVNSKEIIV